MQNPPMPLKVHVDEWAAPISASLDRQTLPTKTVLVLEELVRIQLVRVHLLVVPARLVDPNPLTLQVVYGRPQSVELPSRPPTWPCTHLEIARWYLFRTRY